MPRAGSLQCHDTSPDTFFPGQGLLSCSQGFPWRQAQHFYCRGNPWKLQYAGCIVNPFFSVSSNNERILEPVFTRGKSVLRL